MAKNQANPESKSISPSRSLIAQGWLSIAFWMSVGLLLEGLLGYKIPAYLSDPQRRELFRLAHAHGTLLGVILIAAGLCAERFVVALPKAARLALRAGSILMPVGFFLSGIWHTESDPGLAIWLVPPGALMVIFGAVVLALTCLKKPTARD
jgi:hypothetical protein